MSAVSTYREAPPALALREVLSCRWAHVVPAEQPRHVRLVVPDACLDVVWDGERLVVAGPDTGPWLADCRPGASTLGVRFRPGAAPPLLGVPASALRDADVALAELWNGEGQRLDEEVAAAASDGARLDAIERAIARRRPAVPAPDPVVRHAAGLLGRGEHRRTRELAGRLAIGERQLRRRVRAAVGYAPKTLARVLRLQRLLALARAAPDGERGLAGLAAAAGYADQAHMTHECRALTGLTPGVLLAPGFSRDQPATSVSHKTPARRRATMPVPDPGHGGPPPWSSASASSRSA